MFTKKKKSRGRTCRGRETFFCETLFLCCISNEENKRNENARKHLRFGSVFGSVLFWECFVLGVLCFVFGSVFGIVLWECFVFGSVLGSQSVW